MVGPPVQDLSTIALVKEISGEVGHLVTSQLELAKTELRADLRAEATTVRGLGIAALAALTTVSLLLVTAALALAQAQVMRPWAAGLLVSGVTLAVGGVVALMAWSKRVRSPLKRTRRTIRKDVQWTKERLT